MREALFLSGVSFLLVSGLIIGGQYLLSRKGERAGRRLEKYFSWQEEKQTLQTEKEEQKAKEKKKWKTLKKSDFLLVTIVSAFATSLFFLLLTQNLFLALLLGIVGALGPTFLQRYQEGKKAKLFNDQLPDALTLASNSLKAGYSFLQAMDVVSREMPPPLGEEFGRALKEANLGVPLEDALIQITKRVASEDWDLVLTAVNIQRQVGGNLAAILDNITETIRERVRIQGEIKTLTAQGKISGCIVCLIPFALGLYLYLVNPNYISLLFSRPLGLLLVGMACLSQMVGGLLIYKIIKIEV